LNCELIVSKSKQRKGQISKRSIGIWFQIRWQKSDLTFLLLKYFSVCTFQYSHKLIRNSEIYLVFVCKKNLESSACARLQNMFKYNFKPWNIVASICSWFYHNFKTNFCFLSVIILCFCLLFSDDEKFDRVKVSCWTASVHKKDAQEGGEGGGEDHLVELWQVHCSYLHFCQTKCLHQVGWNNRNCKCGSKQKIVHGKLTDLKNYFFISNLNGLILS